MSHPNYAPKGIVVWSGADETIVKHSLGQSMLECDCRTPATHILEIWDRRGILEFCTVCPICEESGIVFLREWLTA